MTTFEYIGVLADTIAVIGIPVATVKLFMAHKEYRENVKNQEKEEKRKNEEMQIVLQEKNGKRSIYLPNKIRRGELSRAEILGRLGMIPMLPDPENPKIKHPRFEIRRNATQQFIHDIDVLHVASTGNLLTINCETNEVEQFNLIEMEKLGFEIRGFD